MIVKLINVLSIKTLFIIGGGFMKFGNFEGSESNTYCTTYKTYTWSQYKCSNVHIENKKASNSRQWRVQVYYIRELIQ